jgi:IclR family acetate operon transcriptional repressor
MRFDERNGSSVLGRAFRLLGALEAANGELPLAELARRANLPKPTAYRLAGQLVELGVLKQSADGYGLGTRLFEFGSAVAAYRHFREAAIPFMGDLYEATHQTVNLGVMDGLTVLYLEKLRSHKASPVTTAVGGHKPLHCTALGKAMLAFAPPGVLQTVVDHGLPRQTSRTIVLPRLLGEELQRARSDGFVFDREEYTTGTVCVAAPLRSSDGVAFAALSVTGVAKDWDPLRYAAAVRVTALGLNRALLQGDYPAVTAYLASKSAASGPERPP